ncbi:MAG: hypothetical protein QG670_2259 [Thermoproteota archaeon]|nr:hypothetical protein [Thermoproteota archaeon]
MAEASVKGGFNLFWGQAISNIIMSLGVIVVTRLLSPSDYGLYTIALTVPAFITIFRDWGINTAITRYTAQYTQEDKPGEVKAILLAGLLFETILGIALSVFSVLFSDYIATSIFNRPNIAPLIQIVSFTILANAFIAVAQAAFIGLEKTGLNSVIMILQAILKIVLMPTLIILGMGTLGATIGVTLATLLTGIICIGLLFRLTKRLQQANPATKISKIIRVMLTYGLPISISAIITGFSTNFYNLLMAVYCTDLMIGNFQAAVNFSVLIGFFSIPITMILFPIFSKLDGKKESETLRITFRFSVKYASLLVVPATIVVIALAQPAVYTLFGDKYSNAPLYLILLCIPFLYTALGNLSIGNLLNSQGRTQTTMKLTLANTAIGIPLSLILIPNFQIIGIIATNIIATVPSQLLGLYLIRKKYNATISWRSSARILTASAAAGAIAYIVTFQISFSSWIKLALGGTLFIATIILFLPLTGAINKADIQNLKEMQKSLGPVQRISTPVLDTMQKLAPRLPTTQD